MRNVIAAVALLLGVLAVTPAGAFTDLKGTSAWDGQSFPLNDLKGEQRRITDWKGKVILLDFWATWCVPCQVEIRDLIRFQDRFGDRNLQVIGIGLDTADKLKNFARSFGINYPVLVAGAGNLGLSERWGNPQQQVPYTVVITPDGKIVYNGFGVFTPDMFDVVVTPLLSK